MQFLAFCLLLLAFCSLPLAPCLLPLARFPGSVQPTVKIGLVAPFEGRYRYVGYDVIYAVRMALREANAADGVGGYSVELVAYDDGADPAMAVEQARKLAADPAVIAAIGHFREETTGAALSVYAGAGIPLVAPAVLDPVLTEGDGAVFRLGPDADALAAALLDGTAQPLPPDVPSGGLLEMVLVSDDGPLGQSLQHAAQERGGRLTPVVSPDGDGWLAEVIASGADVVFCDADPVTAGEVVAALREGGWEGVFLGGPELASTDFVAVAGQAAEGAVFVTPWPFPADVSGSADFVVDYHAVSNGMSPGPLALSGYEATWVLLEALERDIATHGAPTREGVAAALSATEREGLLGHVTFDAGRNWGDGLLYWYRVGAGGVPQRVRW